MQRLHTKDLVRSPHSLLLFLLIIITACSNGAPKTVTKKTTTAHHPVAATAPASHTRDYPLIRQGQLSSEIDQIARDVLNNIRRHGWNPDAVTKGAVTGGLFVNWQMNNPGHTNALKEGSDDATSMMHDPQTDLDYLTALAEYTTLHPRDHSFNGELSKMTPLIVREFSRYNLPKGWLYFYVLRDGLLLHNTDLINAAYTIASNYYTRWYDPDLGLVYNRAHSPGVVTPEQSMTAGAALINAGLRWHVRAWVQAGKLTIARVTQYGLDTRAHLFYQSLAVSYGGTLQVTNTQAKPPTQGAIAEALVKAYDDTRDQSYLHEAREILQGLFSSDLMDHQYGGMYFARDLQTGQVNKSYKETRAHIHVLIALVAYNNALRTLGQPAQFQSQEQEMINLLTRRFYQEQYHGYFYRMTPTYHVYSSVPGSGIGYEDFFTTEAMGSALDALQQVEFANLPF